MRWRENVRNKQKAFRINFNKKFNIREGSGRRRRRCARRWLLFGGEPKVKLLMESFSLRSSPPPPPNHSRIFLIKIERDIFPAYLESPVIGVGIMNALKALVRRVRLLPYRENMQISVTDPRYLFN